MSVSLILFLAGCDNLPQSSSAAKPPIKEAVEAPPPAVEAQQEDADKHDMGNGYASYSFRDTGHILPIEYATVLKVRKVQIFYPDPNHPKKGDNALFGDGTEYIVITQNGRLYTLVQIKNEFSHSFKVGSHVLIQTGGTYQRMLDTNGLPSRISRPMGTDFGDAQQPDQAKRR